MSSVKVSHTDSKAGQANVSIALDTLCERSAYVTNVSDFVKEKNPRAALLYWINEFERPNTLKTKEDICSAIDRSVAEIDRMICRQLNEIIHHPAFQKLEASWRCLWYLAVQAEGVKNFKLKMLDISWKEVVRDIGRALEFDQSQLFNKVYNDEYGTPGGEPYGVLIGDYEISHRTSKHHFHDDISTLKGLSEIAAASFSPFVAGASSELFGLDDFSNLSSPLNFANIFKQDEYIRWRALRDSADSRFVGLTLPRILVRRPYRTNPGSYKGIFFYEQKHSKDNDCYLWGNACFGFAAILIREFSNVGWFGHIRGVPRNQIGGGLLTNLPVDAFDTDSNDLAYKPSTNTVITDSAEREISELGFIPLCQCYDTPFNAFYSNQSIQKPKRQDSNDATVNAKLSTMLQHILCGSRIAHYIKVIIRDKVGSFVSASDCENLLRRWLLRYTSGRSDMEWEEQARFPIREASVTVKEHTSKPGQYLCAIRIVPHYQLDQMVSELELVTELVQQS
ncbi:MAG: type VI secretion system protein ImpD [Lentisphaeria bacterium]